MALINCSECNREISDKADSCPGCGYKNIIEIELPDFGKKYPHPGPLPTVSAFTLQNRFAQIGTLAGRTREEIISIVGKPNSISQPQLGITMLQWIKASAYPGGYHIALIFDQHGICGGVTHNSSSR